VANPWVAEGPAGGWPPEGPIIMTTSLNVYQICSVEPKNIETEVRLFDGLFRNVVKKVKNSLKVFSTKSKTK
jgi:hypothetical protein